MVEISTMKKTQQDCLKLVAPISTKYWPWHLNSRELLIALAIKSKDYQLAIESLKCCISNR